MDKYIKTICLEALVVRLIALLIIVLYSDDLTSGFISSDMINDDVRYLAGAEIFAKNSNSLFDFAALGDAYLEIGVWQVADGSEFAIWYWIVAELMYIFQSHVAVRIINILFAVLSIKCIYDISSHLYDIKTAKLASKLYAFLPYPVFFSCFLYKDQLYTLIVLLIFRIIIIRVADLRLKDIIYIAILLLFSSFVRSGLSVIIAICVIYIYVRNIKISFDYRKLLFLTPIILIGLFFLYDYSIRSIGTKYEAYVLKYVNENGNTIPFLSIKSITDIYRFPLSYFFIMLLPIVRSFTLDSWLSLTSFLNIIVFPIALGNFIYFFNWTIKKRTFYWVILLMYLITIVTSLGIFRHSYFLQPYMMIFFSHFYMMLKRKTLFKQLSLIFVFGYLLLLIFMP